MQLVQICETVGILCRARRVFFALKPDDSGQVYFGAGGELRVYRIYKVTVEFAGILAAVVEGMIVTVFILRKKRLTILCGNDADLSRGTIDQGSLEYTCRNYSDCFGLTSNDIQSYRRHETTPRKNERVHSWATLVPHTPRRRRYIETREVQDLLEAGGQGGRHQTAALRALTVSRGGYREGSARESGPPGFPDLSASPRRFSARRTSGTRGAMRGASQAPAHRAPKTAAPRRRPRKSLRRRRRTDPRRVPRKGPRGATTARRSLPQRSRARTGPVPLPRHPPLPANGPAQGCPATDLTLCGGPSAGPSRPIRFASKRDGRAAAFPSVAQPRIREGLPEPRNLLSTNDWLLARTVGRGSYVVLSKIRCRADPPHPGTLITRRLVAAATGSGRGFVH